MRKKKRKQKIKERGRHISSSYNCQWLTTTSSSVFFILLLDLKDFSDRKPYRDAYRTGRRPERSRELAVYYDDDLMAILENIVGSRASSYLNTFDSGAARGHSNNKPKRKKNGF